jgi:hypothetical protein
MIITEKDLRTIKKAALAAFVDGEITPFIADVYLAKCYLAAIQEFCVNRNVQITDIKFPEIDEPASLDEY